jgi:hypothetical protein
MTAANHYHHREQLRRRRERPFGGAFIGGARAPAISVFTDVTDLGRA